MVLNERADQAQQFEMLWTVHPSDKELPDFEVCHLALGCRVRLVPDEPKFTSRF